jgi:hypothetical protein
MSKAFCLKLLNFLLSPFVVGHFDDQFCACEFAVVKKNRTAFRFPGGERWGIFNPRSSESIGQSVSVLTPNDCDWNRFDFSKFKEIFEKEQFRHPIRAAIVEVFICA